MSNYRTVEELEGIVAMMRKDRLSTPPNKGSALFQAALAAANARRPARMQAAPTPAIPPAKAPAPATTPAPVKGNGLFKPTPLPTLTKAEFDLLTPADKMRFVKEHGALV